MATIGGIGVVLLVAIVGIAVSRLFWQPPVVGEIVAGIAIGPSLLGLLPGGLPDRLFPPELRSAMATVAQVGVLLFLFTVGWTFSASELKGRRRSTTVIWLSSICVPLLLGAGLALALYGPYGAVDGRRVDVVAFVAFISVAMAVTAFPVLARIIAERGLNHTPVGVLALALAAADDVVAWVLLAGVAAMATFGSAGGIGSVMLWSTTYVLAMALVVRPLLAIVARRLPPRSAPYLPLATAAMVFLSAWVTSAIGIHAIVGAFAMGVVMPRRSETVSLAEVRVPLENVAMVLMPVFFVVTGLSVDLTTLGGSMLLVTTAVTAVACLSKLGGVAVPALLAGMGGRESITLGLLMNTRGLTQLIVLDVGLALGLLSTELFSAMVVMAVVTTAMASPLLRLVQRKQAHNVPEPNLPEGLRVVGGSAGASDTPVRPAAERSD